jgi:hypothetical protein
VIFRVHPEHRDRRDAVLGLDAARQLNRRDGFEQRVERPAKQPGLLTGDDGHRRWLAQPLRGRECGRRRRARLQLPSEDVGDAVTVARAALDACDRLAPGRGSPGFPAKSGATLAKSAAKAVTSGRIQEKRRRSMASRTTVAISDASG